MKIGLIIEGTYPWYMGGVSEWVYQYLSHFSNHEFYILQIATDEYREMDLKHGAYPLTPNVVAFKRIPVPPLEIIHEKNFMNWYRQWQNDIDVLIDADIIHATNTGFAGIIGSQLKKRWQKPFLITEHAIYWKEVELGTHALECGYTIPDSPREIQFFTNYFKNTAQIAYHEADAVISVSKYNLPFQKEMGAENILYIPNGINRNLIRKDRQILNRIPVIGWVGRCSDLKNPLRFIEFIKQCNRIQFPVDGLMLLAQSGEAVLEEKVSEAAAEIDNLTCIWNQKAFPYYPKMDFLCITSRHESQPLVLFEAIAQGVIPCGWEVGDATNEFGIFVSEEQPATELIRRINPIVQDSYRRQKLIQSLQKKIETAHTWEFIFNQYEKIIWQLQGENITIPKLR